MVVLDEDGQCTSRQSSEQSTCNNRAARTQLCELKQAPTRHVSYSFTANVVLPVRCDPIRTDPRFFATSVKVFAAVLVGRELFANDSKQGGEAPICHETTLSILVST